MLPSSEGEEDQPIKEEKIIIDEEQQLIELNDQIDLKLQ